MKILERCKCGCGETVREARNQYVKGHNWRGKKRGKFSEERLREYRRIRNDLSRMPKAVVKPCSKDIAWAAGFIEGEGCFKPTGQVCADQVQREPLERLQRWFGGTIYQKAYPSMGTRQSAYRWQVWGARARGVILTIYQFLSPKRRREAVTAL